MANGAANSSHAKQAAASYRAEFTRLPAVHQALVKKNFPNAGKTRNWESTYGALEYMRGINLPVSTLNALASHPESPEQHKNEGSATISVMVYQSLTQIPKGATNVIIDYGDGCTEITPLVKRDSRAHVTLAAPVSGYPRDFKDYRYPAASWGWA